MGEQHDQNGDGSGRRSKVARVLDTYDLEELGAELEEAWTAAGDERKSLRDLSTYLNKQIIATVLDETGADPLPGQVDTVYRGLRDDDVSSGLKRDIRGRLQRDGVDVDSLEKDLVSYQAIRTYLKREREVEAPQTAGDPVESSLQRIQKLRGRLRAVADKRLGSLAKGGEISLGEHNVIVQVQVYCEDCGRQYSIEELLERDGCTCEE